MYLIYYHAFPFCHTAIHVVLSKRLKRLLIYHLVR
nr:MAG TPA: hypothetical protein [Caudoviricetes sp.]